VTGGAVGGPTAGGGGVGGEVELLALGVGVGVGPVAVGEAAGDGEDATAGAARNATVPATGNLDGVIFHCTGALAPAT
jgi:hypothetical protein